VIYKEYALGQDLETTSHPDDFSRCVLRISEDAKRIIVQAQLSEQGKNDYVFNPSGTYDSITIERPKVVALSARTKIEDIDGLYIRARGHFKDGVFRAEGKTFLIFGRLGKEGDFEIVGQVNQYASGRGAECGLGVSSYKRIPAK
jgi:hypothetical protein